MNGGGGAAGGNGRRLPAARPIGSDHQRSHPMAERSVASVDRGRTTSEAVRNVGDGSHSLNDVTGLGSGFPRHGGGAVILGSPVSLSLTIVPVFPEPIPIHSIEHSRRNRIRVLGLNERRWGCIRRQRVHLAAVAVGR